ncbi:hypothetical protein D3C72_861790 [compost metagenome]
MQGHHAGAFGPECLKTLLAGAVVGDDERLDTGLGGVDAVHQLPELVSGGRAALGRGEPQYADGSAGRLLGELGDDVEIPVAVGGERQGIAPGLFQDNNVGCRLAFGAFGRGCDGRDTGVAMGQAPDESCEAIEVTGDGCVLFGDEVSLHGGPYLGFVPIEYWLENRQN